MTWYGMPVRRRKQAQGRIQFEYWDDDGAWIAYDAYGNTLLTDCQIHGRDQTASYVGSIGYDIFLSSKTPYNRYTGKPPLHG